MKKLLLILSLCAACSLQAQPQSDTVTKMTSLHFQQTVVSQYHAPMDSPYSGRNSLQDEEDWQTSLTGTLFAGLRLWRGASLIFNPEIAGGSGMSSACGIAGFPNGETFRVGNPSPTVYVARLYLRQHFALGDEREEYAEGMNVVGERLPSTRLTLTAGKLCMADVFDQNAYSHDARSQFFNWSLMDAGAWDYPANTRGYTTAFIAEYVSPSLSVRAATSMVPKVANGQDLDANFRTAHSETVEVEVPYVIGGNAGKARILAFTTTAFMGRYREVLDDPGKFDTSIVMSRQYGRSKSGIVLNIEQSFGDGFGAFLRASWNDGKNETWAFTEIDHSVSGGMVVSGTGWNRSDDRFGIAGVINGISADHRAYLAAGGYGFIIGDGALTYGNEYIAEIQYCLHVTENISFTPDYQFVVNPAYNTDRGPVHVFGVRLHTEL